MTPLSNFGYCPRPNRQRARAEAGILGHFERVRYGLERAAGRLQVAAFLSCDK
jgi:hypothetical protein